MMENVFREDPSEDPPRKRLLTDPNPKPTLVTESPESTVSFDSSSDRLAKKTRELPNLSDCHGCSVRINFTNPRERLQPLESMWRIVLLCKKCIKRVNSCDLCPYCFSAVVDVNDCFKCRNCQRCIHKDCVGQYGSGLGLGLGFSVCVDCWLPDAIAKSIRTRKRKRKIRKKNNESCEQTAILPESRVSVVKRKVVLAVKAGGGALRKAAVAKNAVESGKGVLSVVGEKVVDDAELAFLLHRAINSSPRISCLVSPSPCPSRRDDGRLLCYSRRRVRKEIVQLLCYSRKRRKGCLRNSGSLNAQLMCYSRKRFGRKAFSHDIDCECLFCKVSKRIDRHGSTSSADLKPGNGGYSSENGLGGNNCQENDGLGIDSKPHSCLLKYYRTRKGRPRSSVVIKDSDCSRLDSANLCTKGMPDTRNIRNGNECHEISENCDDNTDRFFLKYKRYSRYKPKFSCKVEGFSPMLPNHPVDLTTLSDTI